MGGRKKYPSLSRNLSDAINELGQAFSTEVSGEAKKEFIASIRRHHDRLARLSINSHRILFWTKEGGRRKLVLWVGNRSLEERHNFASWLEEPATQLLRKRGIKVEESPIAIELSHAPGPDDVRWGSDPDLDVVSNGP